MSGEHIKPIAENRKAWFNYHIEDQYEAGMVLLGSEVKSLRNGNDSIKEAYARIKKGEVFVHRMNISEYPFATHQNHEPLRPRKLLLHSHEIRRLYGKVNEKGYSLVPLKLYFKNGKVKLGIALARGKKTHDKRETIKRRDAKRDLDRERKKH